MKKKLKVKYNMSQIPVTKITKNWRITIPPESREGLEMGNLVIVKKDCIKKAKIVEEKQDFGKDGEK